MLFTTRRIVQTAPMNRRNFMLSSSAALAASALHAAEEVKMTDCHVYLGSNPFRQLGAENAAEFIQGLARRGVTEAWAGAFEGLLRRDVANVNRKLAKDCQSSILRPCGTINLSLPDWQDDVKRCAEDHGMRVIRLHPNYHGYDLKAPAFRDLLGLAVKHRLLVQLAARLRTCLRESDTIARLGGDEFAMLLCGLQSTSECQQTLDRLLNAIKTPYLISGETINISASIGYVTSDDREQDLERLMAQADEALYAAKRGGARVRGYAPVGMAAAA